MPPLEVSALPNHLRQPQNSGLFTWQSNCLLKVVRSCIWLIAGASTVWACSGQPFSISIIGGVGGANDLIGPGATSVSKRYVAGPALNTGLPLGFGIEAGALSRREGYRSFLAAAPYTVLNACCVSSNYVCCYPVRRSHPTAAGTYYPGSSGLVIGGGVRFAIGSLRLAPVFRYASLTTSPIRHPDLLSRRRIECSPKSISASC